MKAANGFYELSVKANRFKGQAGVYIEDPFFVIQPEPDKLTHHWSLPENVAGRKLIGWSVVTANRGVLYGLRADEIDKGNNRCTRYGQILMEHDLETAGDRAAWCTVQAITQLEGTKDELINAMDRIGANPRDLENDPKYAKRLRSTDGPTPMEQQRKLGKVSDAESKHLREQRLYQQIRKDAAIQERSHGLQAAVKEMMPQGPFSQEMLSVAPQMVDGVREIVLSANPDLTADFD
jgi:hypothetical protein